MANTSVAGIDVIAAPNSQEIVITRTFQASRQRVFSVYTDPDLIPQWWGPARPSVSARDGMLQEGMTDGLAESMRRIDQLLAS